MNENISLGWKPRTKAVNMFISKVIRNNSKHITRADYKDVKPLLGSENVIFPKVGSLQSRSLRNLFPTGRTITHRDFDYLSSSYRLGGYIGFLRDKGWVIVNHDEMALTNDIVGRTAKFTRYELFADFTLELAERITGYCKAVDEFVRTKGGNNAKSH